jgi:hypothetical protein
MSSYSGVSGDDGKRNELYGVNNPLIPLEGGQLTSIVVSMPNPSDLNAKFSRFGEKVSFVGQSVSIPVTELPLRWEWSMSRPHLPPLTDGLRQMV